VFFFVFFSICSRWRPGWRRPCLEVLAGNISDKEKPSTFFWSFQNNGRLSLSISPKTRVKYSGTPLKARGYSYSCLKTTPSIILDMHDNSGIGLYIYLFVINIFLNG
jgi:hypothetical protein